MANTKKTVTILRVWISVLLAILALVISVQPMITLQTVQNEDKIDKLINELDLDVLDGEELPDEVEIGVGTMISNVGLIADLVGAIKDKNFDSLEESLSSEDAKDALISFVALASTVSGPMLDGDGSSGGTAVWVETIVVGLALLVLLFMIIFLPISMFIKAIGALVTGCSNIKTPEKAAGKLSRTLVKFLSFVFTLMVFQSLIPGMSYGSGVLPLLIIAIASVVMGVLASRLQRYTKNEFTYLNVAQGVSIVGIAGFCLFFFNMMKTGVFTSFLRSNFAVELVRAVNGKGEMSVLIDCALVIFLWALLLGSVKYLIKCVSRLSCSVKAGDVFPVRGIFLLIIAILPRYLGSASREQVYVAFTDEGVSALNLALVGAIIVVVAEFAMIILKGTLCKKLTEEERVAVITGTKLAEATVEVVPTVEEMMGGMHESEAPAAEATAPEAEAATEEAVEEAAAEEAATEEAAEEAATEEAAEEAATEEAAEEAVAEEAAEEAAPEAEATEEAAPAEEDAVAASAEVQDEQ
ncbi:MAG: hypothetical protein E7637_09330 [Ruminococcaceae bacterium]|nr:hypothetical protein [Oscillospiraceae bacterium]